MHATRQRETCQYFTPVDLEPTTTIVHGNSGRPGDQAVGETRWHDSSPIVLLSLLSPATHYRIAFVHFSQQSRDVVRVILSIPVQSDDDTPSGLLESSG